MSWIKSLNAGRFENKCLVVSEAKCMNYKALNDNTCWEGRECQGFLLQAILPKIECFAIRWVEINGEEKQWLRWRFYFTWLDILGPKPDPGTHPIWIPLKSSGASSKRDSYKRIVYHLNQTYWGNYWRMVT